MTPRMLRALSRLYEAEARSAEVRAWAASGERRAQWQREMERLKCIAAEALCRADDVEDAA